MGFEDTYSQRGSGGGFSLFWDEDFEAAEKAACVVPISQSAEDMKEDIVNSSISMTKRRDNSPWYKGLILGSWIKPPQRNGFHNNVWTTCSVPLSAMLMPRKRRFSSTRNGWSILEMVEYVLRIERGCWRFTEGGRGLCSPSFTRRRQIVLLELGFGKVYQTTPFADFKS